MATGNPMGLSEISHFGAFQRVGGKAGGFINKKFFHPSSLRNQERLWKAQTADERESRKQVELQKRRDEERQVEELRKQMYLAGQGKATDLATPSASIEGGTAARAAQSSGSKQTVAIEEQKKRKAMLAQERYDREALDATASGGILIEDHKGGKRPLARSRYPEDQFFLGHSSVWGSWFTTEDKRWGYACCKLATRDAECPLEPAAPTTENATKGGRRRQQRQGGAGIGDEDLPTAGGVSVGGDSDGEAGRTAAPQTKKREPLLDIRFVEAAQRRKEKKLREEQEKREAKEREKEAARSQAYMADLLQDPTGAA